MRRLPFYFATAAAIVCFLGCIRASPTVPATVSPQSSSSVSSLSEAYVVALDIPVQSFAVSPDLLKLIVAKDSECGLFTLPEKPSNTISVKLVYALRSNAKRVGAITYLVKKFTHYEPSSETMLQGSVETFKTLSLLHKSMKDVELYAPVLKAMTEVIEAHINFIKMFKASLVVDRMAQIDAFKDIILDFRSLEGMFYLLANLVSEEIQRHLVDLIFSAVGSEEEEGLVWSFYKRFVSPSNFIPLPHEYLCFHSKEVKTTIAQDLIKIFSVIDSECKAAWLVQLGLLLRFRTISNSEAFSIAKAISLHNLQVRTDHFVNFIRLAFLDDLITEKAPETVTNFFNFRPQKPENLMEFYISLWNLLVSDLPVPLEDSEFSGFLIYVIKYLEIKFPGISEQVDSKLFDQLEELKSIQFIRKIDEFDFDISTEENVEKVIEFIEVFVETEFGEISIKDVRFALNLLYKKFVISIGNLNISPLNDEIYVKLKLIFAEKLQKYSNFIANFSEISEVELFVDFAFSLPEISDAEKFFSFIYAKIDGNAELVAFFFQKFAENLQKRQNFFFLRFDRAEFAKFDRLVIQNFLENIKNCPLSDLLFLFLTGAYLNGFMGQGQLFGFLENFKIGNYSNLNFNGSEFLGFFASISEISYFEFREESPETFQQQSENAQANAIKSLEILSSFDGKLLEDFEFSLIPWVCNRIVAFEQLKPETTETDQLDEFRDVLNSELSIEESAKLCSKLVLHVLKFGASENDLKAIFEFVQNFRKKFDVNFVTNDKRMLAVSSSFCLLIFIIRSNDSIVPIEYALDAMSHYKLKSYRVSVAQLIYKAYKNAEIRADLFPSFVHFCFDRLDHGLVHDPQIFDGMSETTVNALLNPFLGQTFCAGGIDRVRIESFCYWLSLGLISPSMAKEIVEKVGEPRERPIGLKLAVALIRAVFNQEKYAPIRTLTVELLFLNVDHCTISPRPFMSGKIGGVADLVGKPEFLAALTKPSKYSEDLHAILRSEYERKTRINCDSLNLSDGIENVMENYSHALLELASFSLSLERKNMLLRSIFTNLSRITTSFGENDLVAENFTSTLLDHFVRISICLARQIHTDFMAPVYINDLDPETLEIYFAAIIQFVRDSNVQALLTFEILTAIKDRPESREAILEIIPRYINWRRFLLIPDSFRFIFYFSCPVHVFDKFMTETIGAAFRFVDLFPSDAVDHSRHDDQMLQVHESFFSSMTCLINNFNLPAKYTIKALQLMIENYDSIEVISTTLVQFLRAAIKPRQISPESSCYRNTRNSYGLDCVYDSPKEIFKLVIEFLEKRPDFLCMALVNEQESEAYKFVHELESFARTINSTPFNLIRAIFNWPYSGIESLKLISRVYLPKSAIRSLVAWLCSSTSPSYEAVLPIAFVVLDLIPSTFTIETFTDSTASQSWLPISDSIAQWFTKLAADFPKQFGQNIEDRLIEKYLNILLWSLAFDEKEEFVSNSLSIFLDSLTFASAEAKYRAVRLFASNYFRPLLTALAESKPALLALSTNFRKLSEGNLELAKEVEKLIPFLFENKTEDEEDAFLSERSRFLENLNTLDSAEDFQPLKDTLVEICPQISRLRSMGNEHDLTLRFIEKLAELARKFYSQTPTEETALLAFSFSKTLNFLRKELLLQANSNLFLDLFRFLYKHNSTNRKLDVYFEAFDLIFSQIVSTRDVHVVSTILVDDLRLGCCLMPSKGLPKHVYKHKQYMGAFVMEYLVKMNKLGNQDDGNRVDLDGIHFIALFNILAKTNASDDLVRFWIANVSGLKCNDVVTEEFAENLKSFCSARKDFIESLAQIYINEFFVKKMFDMDAGKCKENLFSFFKFVFMHNPQLFHNLVDANLPADLQIQMSKEIDDVLLEKKRKVVQDFVAKCQLPANVDFELFQVFSLTAKLETLLRFDLRLLPSEQFTIFFRRLKLLIDELPNRNLIENSSEIINLLAVSCALQLKNDLTVKTDAILLVLRLSGVLKSNEEIVTLITRQIIKLDHEFTKIDAFSAVQLIEKSSEPTQILKDFLDNPRTLNYRAYIIETVLETKRKSDKIEIHLIVQDLLAALIQKYKQQTAQSLDQFEDLSILIRLARTHKLLGKAQILLLNQLN